MSDIFHTAQIKNIHFANRIVMAPMVRFGFDGQNGVMDRELLEEYLRWSDKGIGLIISQVLSVSPEQAILGGAGAYSDHHVDYLSKIAKAYHEHQTNFFAQLGLPGFSFYEANSATVNQLTKKELVKIRDWFIRSAQICQKAGLDGVELHGAHTFFLNMMASGTANKRQDIYGGDLVGRLTLAKEIIEAVKSFAGDHFIVSYRMGWNEDLNTDIKMAQFLERMGIDLLHVSTGIPADRKLQLPAQFGYNGVVYTGGHVKQQVQIPVIAVNSIRTLARGTRLIESDSCDFVAYGKPFLADADFVSRSKIDNDYQPCLECRQCQWVTDGQKCPAQRRKRKNGGQ